MAYPEKPAIQTSYTAAEQALGNGTLPGQELDVDLAALRTSAEETIEFIKLFTRSDGKLANGIVTQEALAASIRLGFDPPAPWSTGTAYTTRSTVFQGFGFYLCTTAHTSGVFATDLAAGRWQLLADLTPPGGALVATNNLSDLADAAAARTNLGLGSMATANSGTAASQFRTNTQNEAVFQPLDATLTAVAGLSGSANQIPYFTEADTLALTTLTSQGRQLLDDTSFANMRTTLGLVIGTDVQAADAALTSLAGLSLSAGDILYATGADTLQRLAVGTAGQVLRVNTGATAPEWGSGGGFTMLTQANTTSGTNFDFTVPSTATEIIVLFDDVSLSGTDNILVQLIDGGGVQTSGYVSAVALGASFPLTSTAGYIAYCNAAVNSFRGDMNITKMSGNKWLSASKGALYASGSITGAVAGGGVVTLDDACVGVRVTRTGSNTFDLGSVNVGWR